MEGLVEVECTECDGIGDLCFHHNASYMLCDCFESPDPEEDQE